MAFSLHTLSPGLAQAWDRASRRERAMITVAAIVLALAAGWVWIWQPMNDDIARLQRDLPRSHAVLATARVQAEAPVALQRTSVSTKSSDPRAAVERVLAERSLRPRLPRSTPGRPRAPDVRRRALRCVGRAARRAGEDGRVARRRCVLAARVEPGTVRAELTLAR
jgi:hypothetical protein